MKVEQSEVTEIVRVKVNGGIDHVSVEVNEEGFLTLVVGNAEYVLE